MRNSLSAGMPSTNSESRRVLIVMEGLQSAIPQVRTLQYDNLFEQHPRYEVTYAYRTLRFLSNNSKRLHHRLLRRLLFGPVYRKAIRFQEDRIAKLSSEFDIIYSIGVPSLRLHRQLRRQSKSLLIMDMIDGLWLPYHRQFGWEGLDEMIETSDGVICDNQYTFEYARKHNQRVFLVPNAPQLDFFDEWRSQVQRDPNRIVLGWIGSSDTVVSLYAIWEPLEELFARHPELHLRIVGGSPSRLPSFENVRYSVLPKYDQQQMAREVLAMDIGLFPLFHVEDSFTRGSSKARIYMAGETVAACQNLGACRDLIQDGVNGILADSHEEWVKKLERLIENPDLLKKIAKQGLETIRSQYSTQTCFEQLVEVFDTLSES